jgi:hypothetical protein
MSDPGSDGVSSAGGSPRGKSPQDDESSRKASPELDRFDRPSDWMEQPHAEEHVGTLTGGPMEKGSGVDWNEWLEKLFDQDVPNGERSPYTNVLQNMLTGEHYERVRDMYLAEDDEGIEQFFQHRPDPYDCIMYHQSVNEDVHFLQTQLQNERDKCKQLENKCQELQAQVSKRDNAINSLADQQRRWHRIRTEVQADLAAFETQIGTTLDGFENRLTDEVINLIREISPTLTNPTREQAAATLVAVQQRLTGTKRGRDDGVEGCASGRSRPASRRGGLGGRGR